MNYGRLPTCRLLIDASPAVGSWNMAVDEALLESALTGGPPTLRWYQWSRPTLSLGYFQPAAEVLSDPRWHGIEKVRRLTGGGAILHDHEWTYSCVLPAEQQLVKHPYDLYDRIHDAVMAWFADAAGIRLSQRGTTIHELREPTLCFLRQDSHDVVCYGVKVLGSAQRRRKGALLQHGSLVLRRSAHAPELSGLVELAGSEAFLTKRTTLAQFVAERIAERVEISGLSPSEESLAAELAQSRYHTIAQR